MFRGCEEDVKYLIGANGRAVFTASLLFCLIFSYIVYATQFISESAEYVYIYLTNWTFTLFLVNVTLSTIEFFVISLGKRVKVFTFHVSLITRPVYVYVCLVYIVSSILTLSGHGELLSPEHVSKIRYDFLFYFNDISKHYLFVALMLLLFIFAPRTNDAEFMFKWWTFLYPVVFVYAYMSFALLYYVSTGIKIYNISNLFISVLASLTTPLLLTIHICLKIIDNAIKRRLF